MYSKNGKILNINKSSICKAVSGAYGYPDISTYPVPTLQLQANTLADQKILLDGSNNVLQWSDVRNKHTAIKGANTPTYDFTEQAVKGVQPSSQKMTIPYFPDLQFKEDEPFFIEFWFQAQATGVNVALLATRWTTGFVVYIEAANRLNFVYSNTNFSILSPTIVINEWNHIAIQGISGDNYKRMYLNGIYKRGGNFGGDLSSTDDLSLFYEPFYNFYGSALIDDVKIGLWRKYNYADDDGVKYFTPKPRNFPNL